MMDTGRRREMIKDNEQMEERKEKEEEIMDRSWRKG